ncbi:hypothetical protein AAF712_012208 [Marasmius tenuissimus]|uniref:Uncharacterized protein n=1 Tax=Marasmius tenuissimus TaxID=585030 RepID=A0ABR2ZH47_9AGAR
MLGHHEKCEDSSCLHPFVDQLSLCYPLKDIDGFKKWFRDPNIYQQALLRIVIAVTPEVLERINCTKNPHRSHVVRLVHDNISVKLNKVTRARCECETTIFELSPEDFQSVSRGFDMWKIDYDERQKWLKYRRQAIITHKKKCAEAKTARMSTGGVAPMPQYLQR